MGQSLNLQDFNLNNNSTYDEIKDLVQTIRNYPREKVALTTTLSVVIFWLLMC
jgi:hypothetical protein